MQQQADPLQSIIQRVDVALGSRSGESGEGSSRGRGAVFLSRDSVASSPSGAQLQPARSALQSDTGDSSQAERSRGGFSIPGQPASAYPGSHWKRVDGHLVRMSVEYGSSRASSPATSEAFNYSRESSGGQSGENNQGQSQTTGFIRVREPMPESPSQQASNRLQTAMYSEPTYQPRSRSQTPTTASSRERMVRSPSEQASSDIQDTGEARRRSRTPQSAAMARSSPSPAQQEVDAIEVWRRQSLRRVKRESPGPGDPDLKQLDYFLAVNA